MNFYKLDGRTPVPCSLEEFSEYVATGNKCVAKDFVNDVVISTVFLGIDHNFGGNGKPLLFETLVFGGVCDQYMERCSTYDEAEEMHKRVVEIVKDSLAIEGEKSKESLQIGFHPNLKDW